MKNACDLCQGRGWTFRPHVTAWVVLRWLARLACSRYLPPLAQKCAHCDGRGTEPPPWPCGPQPLSPPPQPKKR